ncbi:CBS domain-containing protein [Candidatus Uhrbacteria bacterium]|nr:CBS domain-containing protein [Candidatus Uhrbacteria bacterium]
MKVRDVMETEVYTIPDSTTYEDAAKFLVSRAMSGVLVTDGAGNLVGVLSEKDLFRVLYPYEKSFFETPELYIDREARERKASEIRRHPIGTYMSPTIVSVGPDAPILDAGALMLAKHIHRLPVMADGKLVGIVTRSKIFKAVLKQNFGEPAPIRKKAAPRKRGTA